MKTTAILLGSLMISSFGGSKLQTDALRNEMVKSKISETKSLLVKAYENPKASQTQKEIISTLWNYLQNKKINYPPVGQEYMNVTDDPEYCRKNIAFAYGSDVFICGAYLDQDLTHSQEIINVLIHEVAHATYIDKQLDADEECGADKASVMVYELAGKRSPALDGYYISTGRCKIKSP